MLLISNSNCREKNITFSATYIHVVFNNLYFICLISMPEVQLSVSLYVIISFAVIGVEDVFTIFASTETRLGEPSKVFVCMQFNQTFLSLFSRIFRCPHVSQFIRN